MKSIAIITARGGSKRIPNKNIKLFLDRPIIEYSIKAALDSGLYDEVMVSTDCLEIKEISVKAGAKVPFMRSEKNSNDFATTSEVLLEVLQEYEKVGKRFDYMTCIYPTAPFITTQKLKNSLDILLDNDCDAVIPVVEYSYPPQRAFAIKGNNLVYHCPDNINKRSQDLDKWYHDAGQFYTLNVKSFLEQKIIAMEKSIPYIMSELEVQDIDNEKDWKLAELKYLLLSNDSN